MSENPQSSTRSGADAREVVSITEAAKRLSISVRTIQRRLDSGDLEAVCEGDTRRVRLPEMSRDTTRQVDAPKGDTQRVNRHSRSMQGDSTRHDDTLHDAPYVAPERDSQRDMMFELMAEKDARIVDLRSQVEAANRQAAEATAALREYLKMQNKALPEPISSTRNDAPISPENPPELAQMPQMGKQTQTTKNAARGEGLRDLRAILKSLLGIR